MTRKLETPEEARARLAGEGLRADEQAALWQRVARSTQSRAHAMPARRLVLTFAVAGVTLAGFALGLLLTQPPDAPIAAPAPRAVVDVDACALDARAAAHALPERCGERVLRVANDDWALQGGAVVARVADGARVDRGRVRFAVQHRAPSEQAFVVHVSHGAVRVIGTVFTIEQADGSGSIAVSEGVIEFVWNDGARERVAAGQTLRWPRAPQPQAIEPARADAGVARKASGEPQLDAALERLLQLRSQQRFGEAVRLLRDTLDQRGLTPLQRERISYELGLALDASGAESCAHWKQHVKRFGTERHTRALEEQLGRCE